MWHGYAGPLGEAEIFSAPYFTADDTDGDGLPDEWELLYFGNLDQTLKKECIRPKTPLTLDEAKRIVGEYIDYYNNVRLNSAIGYIAPGDKPEGKHQQIFDERDMKLARAREQRKLKRKVYVKKYAKSA